MNTVKIHINRLGAVRDSEVELKPLMIFSGESGLGKSYVAILVHYVYKLLSENRLQNFFLANGWDVDTLTVTSPQNGTFTVQSSQLLQWINEDACHYMRDSVGNPELPVDVSIQLPITQLLYTFTYRTVLIGMEGKEESNVVFELNGDLNLRVEGNVKSLGGMPWAILLQNSLNREIFGATNIDQTFCMVPGRGALLNIPYTAQDRLKNSKDNKDNKDIYSEFLSDWDIVRTMDPHKERDTDLVARLYDINGGQIEIDEDEKVIYRLTDGKPMPINAAASSIKELAPLYVLLDKYPSSRLSVLFEEPEAHLHPQKQVSIADFVVSAIGHGMHLQITTHSDYFLRRINDRIFLGKIRDLSEPTYKSTIEKYRYTDLTITSSVIGAYLLRRVGADEVKVIPQSLEKGIPYESFYDVIRKDSRHSLDIQQTYYKLIEKDAE